MSPTNFPAAMPSSLMHRKTPLLWIYKDEIQSQRQHLKETLFINNCLREKLERHLSSFDEENGCTSNLYRQIIDSVVQLYNENRVLREEYRRLPRLA
ncbi:myomegalin-like [Macaca nemestrina]|uniref:myomegalin-like n=1 Tax=Macaca nemestrina TaxID=9545 RepID=UPI0039B86933